MLLCFLYLFIDHRRQTMYTDGFSHLEACYLIFTGKGIHFPTFHVPHCHLYIPCGSCLYLYHLLWARFHHNFFHQGGQGIACGFAIEGSPAPFSRFTISIRRWTRKSLRGKVFRWVTLACFRSMSTSTITAAMWSELC